jgi:hypothetical protein
MTPELKPFQQTTTESLRYHLAIISTNQNGRPFLEEQKTI